jgi:nitrite reductase/ring-hydroxylating ferredoxin subunit
MSIPACACEENRREFLRHTVAVVAGAIAGLGALPEAARAFPARLGGPSASTGQERTYPIPAVDGVTIDRDNQVMLVRYQNRAYAFALACPHQNAALRWMDKDERFQCPKHGARFDPAGALISGPPKRNLDRFAVRRDGDSLVVDLAKLFRSDQQKAEWEAASVPL